MIDFVYSSIPVYRSAMTVLYAGRYRRRFADIAALMGDDVRSVCELCFADTIVADACRARGMAWTGIDINRSFCARAGRLGYRAVAGDVLRIDLPAADVFVMAGSLYQFHDRLPELFDAVWNRTRRFILSEPVRNLSSRPGWLGRLAARAARPGPGLAVFRYDERTLLTALETQRSRHPFTLRHISTGRDMLLVLESADTVTGRSGAL